MGERAPRPILAGARGDKLLAQSRLLHLLDRLDLQVQHETMERFMRPCTIQPSWCP